MISEKMNHFYYINGEKAQSVIKSGENNFVGIEINLQKKKKRGRYMRKRIGSSILTVLMILSLSVTNAYATTGYYSDTEADHAKLSFEEMDVSQYNKDSFYDTVEQLKKALTLADNEEQVRKLYEKMIEGFDEASTVNAIYGINYYNNVLDEENAKKSEDMENELVYMTDAACIAVSKLLASEYAAIAKADLGEYAKDWADYKQMTDLEKSLTEKENALTQEYNNLIAEGYQEEDQTAEEKWYESIAKIYIELLDVRNKLVNTSKYDSYMEYAYKDVYGRDYSIKEAEAYRESVKKYIVPLFNKVVEEIQACPAIDDLYDMEGPSTEDTLEAIDEHLKEIDPQLQSAFDYMTTYKLYDIDSSETKMDMGYTINLNQYGVPFLFNTPYNDFSDYTCAIHEFGHFNQMFHQPAHALYEGASYDVSEIHSQGLELLFLEYADDIYGESCADADCLYEMYAMLASVVDGCMYDEFQQKAFEMKEPSVKKLTGLYEELYKEYNGENVEVDTHQWVNISHTFESPFYYISYSTSALAALQIYVMSLDNRENAIDLYMQFTAVDANYGLVEALEKVGIPNVMEDNTVSNIATTLEEQYVGKYTGMRNYRMVVYAVGAVLILLLIVLLLRKVFAKKDEDEDELSKYIYRQEEEIKEGWREDDQAESSKNHDKEEW